MRRKCLGVCKSANNFSSSPVSYLYFRCYDAREESRDTTEAEEATVAQFREIM